MLAPIPVKPIALRFPSYIADKLSVVGASLSAYHLGLPLKGASRDRQCTRRAPFSTLPLSRDRFRSDAHSPMVC